MCLFCWIYLRETICKYMLSIRRVGKLMAHLIDLKTSYIVTYDQQSGAEPQEDKRKKAGLLGLPFTAQGLGAYELTDVLMLRSSLYVATWIIDYNAMAVHVISDAMVCYYPYVRWPMYMTPVMMEWH